MLDCGRVAVDDAARLERVYLGFNLNVMMLIKPRLPVAIPALPWSAVVQVAFSGVQV